MDETWSKPWTSCLAEVAEVRSLERVAQIPDFRVRFAEPQQCRPLEPEELAAAGAAAVEREVRPGGDWFARWSDELFASLRFSDHESLSQPVSTILLVSSAEPEPLSQFESLIHVRGCSLIEAAVNEPEFEQ